MVRSPLMAASATLALNAGVWFRRGRLDMISPDSQATACLPSGRNSTYRPVQISGTSTDIGDQDTRVTSKELVQEVSQWKLEAKSEDNDRYFFHVKEVSNVEGGDKCYVIGRKGSGKTAISEYLGRIVDHETFSDKL